MNDQDSLKRNISRFGNIEVFNEEAYRFEIKLTGFSNHPRNCHDLISIINAFYGWKFKFVELVVAKNDLFHYVLK